MFTFLLVVLILVSIALVAVILLQRSEGGALGMGGGSGAFMSARGTANFLTRLTSGLGIAFFALAIGLVIAGNFERGGSSVTDRVQVQGVDLRELAKKDAPPAAQAPAPAQPAGSTESLDALTAPLPTAGAPTPQPAAPPAK